MTVGHDSTTIGRSGTWRTPPLGLIAVIYSTTRPSTPLSMSRSQIVPDLMSEHIDRPGVGRIGRLSIHRLAVAYFILIYT